MTKKPFDTACNQTAGTQLTGGARSTAEAMRKHAAHRAEPAAKAKSKHPDAVAHAERCEAAACKWGG